MFMRFGLCLSGLLVLLLLVLVVGHVHAQSVNLEESVSITVDCTKGTVDVSSSEYCSAVNDTTPLHTPSGVNLTNMNWYDVRDVTLTFSASKSELNIWLLNTSAARSIGDAWAAMLSTPFQTSLTYEYTAFSFIDYNATGKNNLPQYMQSLMSWCFASDLNGFSPTFVQIAGQPGAIITVDMSTTSNYEWAYTVKCSYETSMPTGSGDHTVNVLNLLGVTSLTPSSYSGSYDSTYLTEVYAATVDVTIMPSQTVTYTSSQPAGLATTMPLGVLAPRGWHDYTGDGTTPVFSFMNDSSPANQLTYTFNGAVVPEFPSTMILSIFMVIFTLAAIVAIRTFHGKTKIKN
jgi:hypothetical protein